MLFFGDSGTCAKTRQPRSSVEPKRLQMLRFVEAGAVLVLFCVLFCKTPETPAKQPVVSHFSLLHQRLKHPETPKTVSTLTSLDSPYMREAYTTMYR